ncbi:MAG TPA: M1 family peptidase, partial [Arachidicoccus soli]|nr:M1 family peptidase [Arachidicoccus soli]
NLNWFFQNWFFTNNYIDLKINGVKKQKDDYVVEIRNVGGFAIPFDIVMTYADGQTARIHETPAIWKSNEQEQRIKIPSKQAIQSIQLDGGIFMDYTPKDNEWKAE